MSVWHFDVKNAADLDARLREILSLDNVGRGDEVNGTVHVSYSDEHVRRATLIGVLEARGVSFSWDKQR
jgi:hypothetical protein